MRTDDNLELLDDEVLIYCQPANDMLPHPDACLLTGITPQLALSKGLRESEFAAQIRKAMLVPGTCVAGYNSIRFDDEFTRNILYRNLYDPYEREYSNGNSRWDIIDLARAYYALRPQGIEWPRHDTGKPSFKLEHLSKANGIEHGEAHDALSDVRATLGLARKLREVQPRLFEYGLTMRSKDRVARLINPHTRTAFVHTSSRIPAERGCTSIMWPVCPHPANPKAVLCIDLNTNVEELLQLSAEQMADRLFTPAKDLPEGIERISVKSIASNKVPFVAPLNVLKHADMDRIQLDYDKCMQNAQLASGDSELATKLSELFGPYSSDAISDPDLMIYSGSFFKRHDKTLMSKVHTNRPEQLAADKFLFNDERLAEMLLRFRARNYPETLTGDEVALWDEFRRHRLLDESGPGGLAFTEYQAIIQQWRERPDLSIGQIEILDQLAAWPLEIGIPGMISET